MHNRVGAAVATMALAASAFGALPVSAATWGSAIGDVSVTTIVVSAEYAQTGLVVVSGRVTSGCHSSCNRLFISHDGGSTWSQAAASGWQGGPPVLGIAGDGHEVLFARGGTVLQRSDDYGATWQTTGGSGNPTVLPSFRSTGEVAVAAAPDYLLGASGSRNVAGSGGAYWDTGFFFNPAYPSGGSFSPALLAGADHNNLPVVLRCDANLSCSGATALPGATPTYSLPVTLLPSSTFGQDGTIFAQTARGIYKSTNGGATFAPLAIGQPGADATITSMLALAPGYQENGPSHVLYAAVEQTYSRPQPYSSGGIYRSADGGRSWAVISSGDLNQGAAAVAVAPDGRLFAAYDGTWGSGLVCSTNGTAWATSCPPVGTWARVAAPRQPAAAGATSCRAMTCQAQNTSTALKTGHAAAGAGAAGGAAGSFTNVPGSATHSSAAGSRQPGLQVPLVAAGLLLAVIGVVVALFQRGRVGRRDARKRPSARAKAAEA